MTYVNILILIVSNILILLLEILYVDNEAIL